MLTPHRIVAAVTVVHAALGAWIATAMTGPLLAIDDLAYLSMGRTLAGGGASPLGAQPPYGVLYPAVLAPGWLFGLDEGQMIVFAQVSNAVLGAALVPVLFAILRRLTDVGFGPALAAAAIGASLPAAWLTGTVVWAERLLPLLVALAVLLFLRLREAPSLGRGAGVALVAAALFAAHPRTVAVALVVLAAAGWILVVGQRRRLATGVAGAGLIGLAAAELARRALAQATFGADATYDGADLASRRGFDELPDMVVRGGGTVAYLLLATAGLAVLGAIVLARNRSVALVYAAMLGATVAVAGWFLVGVGRADAYLHGRYIEVFAPLLVALGVIGARQLPWRLGVGLIGTSVVVAGLYGAWAGPGDNWARSRTPVMMLGVDVSGAPFGQSVFQPGAAAAMALVAGLLVLAAARSRRWALPGVATVIVGVAVLSGIDSIDTLRENTTVGQVQAALADVEVGELAVDRGRVSSTVVGAVAWEVGFDRTTLDRTGSTTHVLLPTEAVPPEGSQMVAEFSGATLWAVP